MINTYKKLAADELDDLNLLEESYWFLHARANLEMGTKIPNTFFVRLLLREKEIAFEVLLILLETGILVKLTSKGL